MKYQDALLHALYDRAAKWGLFKFSLKTGFRAEEETKIILANEFGYSFPGRKISPCDHHPFELDGRTIYFDGSNNLILEAWEYVDNSTYPLLYDQQDLFNVNGISYNILSNFQETIPGQIGAGSVSTIYQEIGYT